MLGHQPYVTSPTWGPPPSCKQVLSEEDVKKNSSGKTDYNNFMVICASIAFNFLSRSIIAIRKSRRLGTVLVPKYGLK